MMICYRFRNSSKLEQQSDVAQGLFIETFQAFLGVSDKVVSGIGNWPWLIPFKCNEVVLPQRWHPKISHWFSSVPLPKSRGADTSKGRCLKNEIHIFLVQSHKSLCHGHDTKLHLRRSSSSADLDSMESFPHCHYSQANSDPEWLWLFGSHQWLW